MRILKIAAVVTLIVFFGGCSRADLTSALPAQPLSPVVTRVLDDTSAYKQLYRFKGGQDGQHPRGGLTALGGLLYGTTELGGGSRATCSAGCGTVFSIDPASGAETVVYRFKGGTDAAQPAAKLSNVNGKLYGTTGRGGDINCYGNGCGTLFVFDPASRNERVLHGFSGGRDGEVPFAGVILVGRKLYGTTASGGSGCDCGTIFSFDLPTGRERVSYAFKGGQDGHGPQADLVFLNGKLYGTTVWGGSGSCTDEISEVIGCGVIFAFDASSGREDVEYSFAGGNDGSYPLMLTVESGMLFGVAYAGGLSGCPQFYDECGAVFSFKPSSGAEAIVHRFKPGRNGSGPVAIVAAHHMLFGASEYGGVGCDTFHCGTIFSLDPSSGKESTLYRFQGLRNLDGAYPVGLIPVAGKLYGITAGGGERSCKANGGCGAVYALNE